MFVYVNVKENQIAAYSGSDEEKFPLPDGSIGLPGHYRIVEVYR